MRRSDSRRGMVLVTVLWLISLLSALAMAASVTFRGFAGAMAVERDRVQGEALLTAGLETAAGIMNSSGDSPLAEIETTTTLGTGTVRVHLNDEGGRIDVGKAPVELIAAMLRSIGAPAGAANTVARRIVERRDPGHAAGSDNPRGPANVAPSVPGTTLQPFADIGPASPDNPRGPANVAPSVPGTTLQPFADIGQLQAIPGMAPDWVAAVAPLATVFGNQTVNPLTAPSGVIAALPGIDDQRVAEFLEARRNFPSDADRLVRILGSAEQYLAVKPQRVASVDLTVALSSGYAAAAHAVIVALPKDSQPYRVLAWTPVPNHTVSVGPMAQR